jgi:hypothetical protein
MIVVSRGQARDTCRNRALATILQSVAQVYRTGEELSRHSIVRIPAGLDANP